MSPATTPFPLASTLDREVREVMTPGVVSLPASASLRRVHETLVAHHLHAVLITDPASHEPLGWVTARGLLRWAGRVGSMRTARQGISEPVVRISPSAAIGAAVEAMMDGEVSHLLVVRGHSNSPEGVVSDIDIVRVDGRF